MINGAGKQALNNSGPPVTISFAELGFRVAANPFGRPKHGFGQGQERPVDRLQAEKMNVAGKAAMVETER
jgi:hypothetical protein